MFCFRQSGDVERGVAELSALNLKSTLCWKFQANSSAPAGVNFT
jgi:hypothetical protein